MNLNTKAPAYGRPLMARRAAGWLPFVVVVAVGAVADWETLRNRPDVARIGLVPNFPLPRGDWRCLRGLDVLLSYVDHMGWTPEHQQQRYALARELIWKSGEPATLWEVESGVAWQLFPWPVGDGSFTFDRLGNGFDVRSPEFVRQVQAVRQSALLTGSGFLGRPEFDPERSAVLERRAG